MLQFCSFESLRGILESTAINGREEMSFATGFVAAALPLALLSPSSCMPKGNVAMGFVTSHPAAVIREFLEEAGGCAVIDGGLATQLETHGADLNDPLWSAHCLFSSPDLIKKVHLDYLDAGANILITASYQATIQGFESGGFSAEQGEDLLRKCIDLACEARRIYEDRCSEGSCDSAENCFSSKRPILVAASVGPYGAYLADGSEYSGDYGKDVTLETLKDFHRRRLHVLVKAGPDLVAFETIPCKLEAQAYIELLEEANIEIPAWLSFSSKDGINIASGDSLAECVSIADSCKKVVAIGINCTPPRYIHQLILSIRDVSGKPIIIYPNSGESYDPVEKKWVESTGAAADEDFISYIAHWHEAGASLIGGCCRTTPNTIRAIARTLGKNYLSVQK
ncbi:Homocysteine S-methyltransferase 3 [Apostasia shenzhenica]|uniref:homocysteine S-methyltransferase n=1 Tax=Apostasia shenzhenica TaxID=1088818 RepID=A0A2H9ZZS1_9ASPA|nr:Homocysteine S-methyltransferase 3 [Apostasia shenzhenica]